MKKICSVLMCTGFVCLLNTYAADVQVNVDNRNNVNSTAQINADHQHLGRMNKASKLIGMSVKNQHNEDLGGIKDLMIDPKSGRIIYAVLGTGGFLGVGDKLIAIPPSAFTSQNDRYLILNADKQALRDAPSFDRHNWPAVADTRWLGMSSSQYSSRPMVQGEIRESAGAEVHVKEPAGAERRHSATISSGESSGWIPGKSVQGQSTVQSGPAVSALENRPMRVGSIMGMNVKNERGEKLGEIEDMAVDMQSGRVLYAVMSDDALLGMRDRLYAVPLDALKLATEANTLLLNADAATLRSTPGFVKNDWPDRADARFYNMAPATAAAVGSTQIDQSAGAERRNIQATTNREPMVYSDHDLKKQLNKSITSDTSFSTSAHHVDITVRNGKVTLHGTVDNAAERDRLISKAESIAGAGNVTSDLTLKTTK